MILNFRWYRRQPSSEGYGLVVSTLSEAEAGFGETLKAALVYINFKCVWFES